jgi:hypothetical protein
MTGVIPLFMRASMIALEHGAQQVWRRTLLSPIGASIISLRFAMNMFYDSKDKGFLSIFAGYL